MTHCLANHQVAGHLMFLFVSTRRDITCSTIHNPPAVKFSLLAFYTLQIRVLLKSIVNYASAVHGQNISSDGTVRHWCRMFKDRLTNVLGEKTSRRPAICSEC
jgi:hypothetical protein